MTYKPAAANMKEQYFHSDKILHQAQVLLQSVPVNSRKSVGSFDPQHSALLILDMQRYFLEEVSHAFIPSALAILSNLNSLIHAYYNAGLPVVFTRHLNNAENAAQMGVWWREVISQENPLSEITSALDTSHAAIFHKSQYDAFYKTEIEQYLKEKSVTQVVTCGVMTHLCCETTARSAFVHGFQVFFPVDGTATYTRAHHQGTILNLAHGFAVLAATPDLVHKVESVGHG